MISSLWPKFPIEKSSAMCDSLLMVSDLASKADCSHVNFQGAIIKVVMCADVLLKSSVS